MPLALLALTIGAFAIGTTEFVIVGLVPPLLTTCDLAAFCGTAGLYLRAGRGDRCAGADGVDRAYAA
jgi:hypothetical protein